MQFFFVGLTNAYARGAKQNGAKILEDFPVTEILTDEDKKGNKKIIGIRSEEKCVSSLFINN